MKQAGLWSSEGDRVVAARWKRLPEKVRTEIVAQLVRAVVSAVIRANEKTQEAKEEKR